MIFDLIYNLRADAIPSDNFATVLGYLVSGDGGGGDFYWDATDTTSADNEGTIFISSKDPNGRWKRLYSGAVNVKWFGANKVASMVNNKKFVDKAFNAVDASGGGIVDIPYDINYGFDRYDKETQPYYKDVTSDVLVRDYSKTGDLTGGSQARYFFNTAHEDMGDTDGNGFHVRGAYHPYFMVMNDANKLTTNNRNADILFGNNGRVNWGIGQGGPSITPDGKTDNDLKLSNFKIAAHNIDGAGANSYTNMMYILQASGNIGFNTDNPSSDFHFVCLHNKKSPAGVFILENKKPGNAQFIITTTSKFTRRLTVDNSTGEFQITESKGLSPRFIFGDDYIKIINTSIYSGIGIPSIAAPRSSIYLQSDTKDCNNIWVKQNSGIETKSGWIPLAQINSGDNAHRPMVTATGFQYFDTTLGKPIWWNGTAWVDSTGIVA